MDNRSQRANLPDEKRKARRKKNKEATRRCLMAGTISHGGKDLTQVDGIDVMTAVSNTYLGTQFRRLRT